MRKKEIIINNFDNFTEFLDFVTKNSLEGGRSKFNGNKDFFGTENFGDALKLAKTGYKQNLETFSKMIKESEIQKIDTETVRDTTGMYFDIGDVITGAPECWYSEESTSAKNTYSIYIECGYDYTIKTDEILKRGAKILSYIDKLHNDGNIVDIYITFNGFYHGKFEQKEFTTIKLPSKPFDIDLYCYIISHPSFFRRIGFAYHEIIFKDISAPARTRPQRWLPIEIEGIYIPSITYGSSVEKYFEVQEDVPNE